MSTSVLSKPVKSNIALKDYVEVENIKYYVDNTKVVLEPTKKEIAVAVWLSKKLNKKVEILPRINIPKGIKTADYLIDNQKCDLKNIVSNRNNAIYTSIRGQERQANNFIFDISKSKLTVKATIKQIYGVFSMKGFNWINSVIIKKNNSIEIIKR